MTRLRSLALTALLALSVFTGGFAVPAHAQVETGLNEVGATVVLPSTDPRVIVARVINVALGLIGLVLLVLILYAGFTWMTAGGDAEKIDRAKKTLRNAIIGLVIVLSAWAITTFVINSLLQATTGGGGAGGGGGPGGGGLPGGGGAGLFQVRSISPQGTLTIRNVTVRFQFTRDVDPASASTTITVVRASDGAAVSGSLNVSGALVTFTPSAPCPAPNADRFCFDSDTDYTARVGTGLRSTGGQTITCGGFASACEGSFRTGNIVDTASPDARIIAPFSGQSVPVNDFVRVITRVTDDGGVSYVETSVDGATIGTGVPSATSTATSSDMEVPWDTTGAALGRHTLQSRAFDIDSNQSDSPSVSVWVRPAHCFNGSFDGDETGLDCGGSCGACSGGSCTEGGECASGVCSGGVCVDQPIITAISPEDGRIGTMVTISGANFGTSTGQVTFSDGRIATAPAVCSAAGINTWSPSQVIVSVPDSSVSGPIALQNAVSGLSDTTNNDQGPVLDDFIVNDVARPGLCAARPTSGLPGERFELVGAGLGSSSELVLFNDREINSFLSWTDTAIELNTPVITPATYAVSARSGGVQSNAVSYRIQERGVSAVPVIDGLTPDTGPIGEYVTITGRNFGTRIGRVVFRNAGGEEGSADVSFPVECEVNFWSDRSIVVKVPARIGSLAGTPVTNGAYQIYVERQDGVESDTASFTVASGTPRPGICAIRPTAGPVDTEVQIIGERLGSAGRVTFKGAGTTRVEAFVDAGDWSSSRITTQVPRTSETGSVIVSVDTRDSNPIEFAVRNCNEDATVCSAAGETCCASGACSVAGVCPTVALNAHYAWRTSTGIIPINPEVVEECTAALPASPSPWSDRVGGNQACVNADIVIRFNTHLDASTVRTAGAATLIVRRCTGAPEDPCAATEPVTPVAGFPRVNTYGEGDYILFRPNLPDGIWAPSSIYEVILRTGITSDTGIPMLENEECGDGNSYCFRFGTRSTSDLCAVGSINILPNPFTAETLFEEITYQGFPRAADDMCLALNGSAYNWFWHTDGDGRAGITNNRGTDGNVLDLQTGTALGETGDIPVPIKGRIFERIIDDNVEGIANLFIRFQPPRVEAYGPNCDEACLNAAVWARFNVPMNPATITPSSIAVYKCATENCRTFNPVSPLDLSRARIELRDGPTGIEDSYLVIEPTVPGPGGAPVLLLEPGQFYKVILLGGGARFYSRNNVPLSEFNDPQGFAWTFRVKSGENPRCTVDRVEVAPQEKFENAIGRRQVFVASPVSAPSACNRDGEPLVVDQNFTWNSSDTLVSKFVNATGDGLVDTRATRAPGCSGRCTPTGSDGIAGRVASCGNSTIETSNPAYCRNAAGTGPCTVGGTGCRTIHGAACILMPPGSRGAEECDDGIANGPTGRCSSNCLWNPVTGGTCTNEVLDPGEQCNPTVCYRGACGPDLPGCSDTCQLMGSRVGGSVCGNGAIGDGEACDDGNRVSGDGCSADCLHEGSFPVRALCGNGTLEPGETCERVAPYLPWPSPACNETTCLKTGTVACAAAGDPNCCGNGTTDAAEDCDDGNTVNGDGCSNRCLLEGSSAGYPAPSFCGDGTAGTGELLACEGAAGDSLIDATQLSEIVGDREPDASGRMSSNLTATIESRTGNATHGLQCGFTEESSCPAGTGLTTNGCCSARPQLVSLSPPADSTGVCRNVMISGLFNVKMDQASMATNVIVAEEAAGAVCPPGTQDASTLPYVAQETGWRSWLANLWRNIVSFFTGSPADAQLYCAGGASGRVVLQNEGDATRVNFIVDRALKANTRYKVVFRGDPDLADALRQGIRSTRGVVVAADPISATRGAFTWTFTTGPDVCAVSEVRVRDTHRTSPDLFTQANEAHDYVADVVFQSGATVSTLAPVAEYSWSWQPWISSEPSIISVSSVASGPSANLAQATSSNQNGTSFIFAGIRITNDEVHTPSTTGSVIRSSKLATVMLCERPWPERSLAPFADAEASASLAAFAPLFVAGPYYNFSTLYCMDAGAADVTTDDLPYATMSAVPLTDLDRSLGILRQYLMTFTEDALRGDGIGFRIVQNPLHLSPSAWYASKGFTGSPEATTVDGYEAVRDGTTVYIAGANVAASTLGPVYSNIYIVSHNPDATETTKQIFDQLIDNFALNINIRNNALNACVDSTDEPYVSGGQVVSCSADWECLDLDPGLRCASFKPKIQRDLKRIADFQTMSDRLAGTRDRDGRYPILDTGTFVQTLSNSRWPSWQGAFSSAAGGALPADPVNRFLTCGRCSGAGAGAGKPCADASECSAGQTCEPTEAGLDPATCWNAETRRFVCPVLNPAVAESVSRIYQYRAVDGGNRYELATELEGPIASRYDPPLLTEILKCSNVDAVCRTNDDCTVRNTAGTVISTGSCVGTGGRWLYSGVCTGRTYGVDDVCGNGVIGSAELCEVGDTRLTACTVAGGAAGTEEQICEDCTRFVAGPSTLCVANVQCGNGRVDAGETCDDGALNGTYGRCNRTCSGYDAYCGDSRLSPGETCDRGASNGAYCRVGDGCTLSASCSFDCRGVAPYCGDGTLNGPEACDGTVETTTSAVCVGGTNAGGLCDDAADCPGGACGGPGPGGASMNACTGTISICSNDRDGNGRIDDACTDDASCTRTGTGGLVISSGRCIARATQRTRGCYTTSESATLACTWKNWSACQPVGTCGDGRVDSGEECDDGNTNNNDACTNVCRNNVCGDAALYSGVEECDFGDRNGTLSCSADYGSTCASCSVTCRQVASSGGFCGNGVKEGPEQCDLTDGLSGVTCRTLGYDYAANVLCRSRGYVTFNGEYQGIWHSPACCNGNFRGNWISTSPTTPPSCVIISPLTAEEGDCREYPSTGSAMGEVPQELADTVCQVGSPRQDAVSCASSCTYAGCRRCTEGGGDASISGQVFDAVYYNQPVPNARVTLFNRGIRVAETFTSDNGSFTLTGLIDLPQCSTYRIIVDSYVDNPCTGNTNEGYRSEHPETGCNGSSWPSYYSGSQNEGENGGYWPYESKVFNTDNFRTTGIQNSDGFIFLAPRVGRDETLVINTFNGGSVVDAHLVLPPSVKFRFVSGGPTSVKSDDVWAMCPGTSSTCRSTVNWQGGQGNANLDLAPHGNLYCVSTGTPPDDCTYFDTPQTLKYKRGPWATTGLYSYYLVDYFAGGSSPPATFRSKNSQVRIITEDRLFTVDAPAGGATCTHDPDPALPDPNPGTPVKEGVDQPPDKRGKFWLVFQQSAVTGQITIPSDTDALRCFGQDSNTGHGTDLPYPLGDLWVTYQ